VDGQGIYCLDAGISDEYQPETDAVEFCAGKASDRFCRGNGGLPVRVSPVSRTIGAENFGSYFNRPVALPTLIV